MTHRSLTAQVQRQTLSHRSQRRTCHTLIQLTKVLGMFVTW